MQAENRTGRRGVNEFFLGRADSGEVLVARSRARLQFEPRGAMKAWRNAIAREARTLRAGDGQLLHAVYASADETDCDAENILFYNVGTGCFRGAAGAGLRFERRYDMSEQATEAGALHEQSYRIATVSEDFTAWRLTEPVARLGPLSLPAITADMKPDLIWRAVAEGRVEPLGSAEGRRFGIRLELQGPITSSFNAAAVVKPLLDGVLSALHFHSDPVAAQAAARRLAARLDGESDQIAHLLVDRRRAVLGGRALLHLRGTGVQWDPADHLCVACDFRVRSAGAGWQLTGAVHNLAPTGGVASVVAAPVKLQDGAPPTPPEQTAHKKPMAIRATGVPFVSSVQIFQDDDDGYLRWLTEHPDGLVLNILRSLNASTSRLHRVGCRTIEGQPPRGGPWTGPYIKGCADTESQIVSWARAHARGPVRVCQLPTCKSLERFLT